MNILQVIYTTESKGQFIANFPLDCFEIADPIATRLFLKAMFAAHFCFEPKGWEKEAIAASATPGRAHIPYREHHIPDITKISMCLSVAAGYVEPNWYMQCGGKIYFKSL